MIGCLSLSVLRLKSDWLLVRPQALDLLLDRMKGAGLDFSRVRALSGSGQVRHLTGHKVKTGGSWSKQFFSLSNTAASTGDEEHLRRCGTSTRTRTWSSSCRSVVLDSEL